VAHALSGIRVFAPVIGIPTLLVAAATTLLLALYPLLPSNLIWLPYLIPVVIASVRWGFLGASAASILAAATGDFFFTQPYYSFWMENPRDVQALLLFLLVAFGAALVINKGRSSNHSELKSTSAIHQLLFDPSDCHTTSDIISRFNRWLRAVARGRMTFIRGPFVDPQLALVPDEIRRITIEMCGAKFDGVRAITTAANKQWFLKQLRLDHAIHGILALEIEGDAHDRTFVEAAITGAAMRFSDLARQETLAGAAKYVLGAEFTHRWRTHLTTVLGAASVLQLRAHAADQVEYTLFEDIRDEAVRLGRLLRNTFSALRATVDGIHSCPDWTDPTDLLASTLDQTTPRSSAAVIKTAIEKDLPLIEIDTELFAEGCGQLLSDELRSSPPKSMIKVDVHRAEREVAISISRERSREAADEDGDLITRSQPPLQNPANRSDLGIWITSSRVRAAGAIFNHAPRHSLYGPIAIFRIPVRPSNQTRPA
jgi:two-component system sensor histidine kinase KdpD